MSETTTYCLNPIGFIRSPLKIREDAPKQGIEGAPDAWLEVTASVAEGLQGIAAGQEIILITWFHLASRNVLKLHPRGNKKLPLTGVFMTRSNDRPNPLGARKRLAQQIGYKGALNGSAEMNIWLYQQIIKMIRESGGVMPGDLSGQPQQGR